VGATPSATVSTSSSAEAAEAVRRFPIRIGRRSRPLLLLFGVRRHNAYVDLGRDVDVRFGFFRVTTPVSNLAGWRIEGPWAWITAIGVRNGIRHGDVAFDGTHTGGVRMDLREPIRFGPLRRTAIYVTVEDLEGFAEALASLGIPGTDGRTGPTH
jgi:hypothetical protein